MNRARAHCFSLSNGGTRLGDLCHGLGIREHRDGLLERLKFLGGDQDCSGLAVTCDGDSLVSQVHRLDEFGKMDLSIHQWCDSHEPNYSQEGLPVKHSVRGCGPNDT